MTEQERRHFDKLYARMIEYNKNKKLKNKAVLRFLDLISYLLTVTTYNVKRSLDSQVFNVIFDVSVGEESKYFIMRHFIGYGNNNTSVAVNFSDNPDRVYSVSQPIFVGNRTRRNLLANVKRMFDTLPDQVKCEMYLNGLRINYELTD